MKKLFTTLGVILVFGIASAQENKIEASTTASPPPGTPVIEKSTDKQVQQQQRNGASTSIVSAPPVYSTPSTSTTTVREEQQLAPVNPISNPNSYPGAATAYPAAQGTMQPGTPTSTTQPVNGVNNPTTTLPASTTSNQGKLP